MTKGYVALVDDTDYEQISKFKWYWTHGYARRDLKVNGKRFRIYLHRVVACAPEGMLVDHIDGNRLNNCRQNLRLCTNTENIRAQAGWSKPKSSIYKGVQKSRGKWRASIMVDRKAIHLGRFDAESAAALAYNAAAMEKFGAFARLNVVP